MLRLLIPIAIIMMLSSCQTSEEAVDIYLDEAGSLYGEAAEALYSEALGSTDAEEIYYNLAYSHLQQGEWKEAADVAGEALAIYPDMVRFMYLRAYAFREAGMMRSYEEELREILARDPADVDIRVLLARRYQASGRDSWAEEEARTILAYDHANADAISILARYSDFFRAIDKAADEASLEAGWSQEPELYDPLEILAGGRLIPRP